MRNRGNLESLRGHFRYARHNESYVALPALETATPKKFLQFELKGKPHCQSPSRSIRLAELARR